MKPVYFINVYFLVELYIPIGGNGMQGIWNCFALFLITAGDSTIISQ